jgi:hypothetical protein
MTALDGWDNFYVLMGSSAGALIGLQFVVMALIADMPAAEKDAHAGKAFGTSNVVHFGVVLLISALVVAPWQELMILSILWGLIGVGGAVYVFTVTLHMRAQRIYQPVFEDWLYNVLLPLAAYILLAVSAWTARVYTREALFVVGAAALVLLFVGIHNAWDTVMWHVFTKKQRPRNSESDETP